MQVTLQFIFSVYNLLIWKVSALESVQYSEYFLCHFYSVSLLRV